jgi:hypothetical protein
MRTIFIAKSSISALLFLLAACHTVDTQLTSLQVPGDVKEIRGTKTQVIQATFHSSERLDWYTNEQGVFVGVIPSLCKNHAPLIILPENIQHHGNSQYAIPVHQPIFGPDDLEYSFSFPAKQNEFEPGEYDYKVPPYNLEKDPQDVCVVFQARDSIALFFPYSYDFSKELVIPKEKISALLH